MVQFEVCGKTQGQFSFDVNCLICTHDPFLFSRHEDLSQLYPQKQCLEGLFSILINSFFPLLNQHLLSSCCVPRKRAKCHVYIHL